MAGGFFGGLAQGVGQGVKLVDDLEKQGREREVRQNERRSEAILAQVRPPGTEDDPRWSSETAVNTAIESAKPKPNIIERMARTVMGRGLDVDTAAQASGVKPPPAPTAAIPAQPGGPVMGAGGQGKVAGGDGGATVDVLEVTPPGPHVRTEVDNARLMYAAAVARRDPTAIAAAQEGLIKAEASEGAKGLATAAANGPHALVNFAHRMGVDGDFETTPTGKLRFKTDDGAYVGGEYSSATEFANENLLPILQRSPQLGLDIAAKYASERRAQQELDSNISYRKAVAAAQTSNARAAMINAQSGAAQTGANVARLNEETRGLKATNDVKVNWGQGLADYSFSTLTDPRLDQLMPQAASDKDDNYRVPITDPASGMVMGYRDGSHAADALAARQRYDMQIYNSTPEVKAGWVGYDRNSRSFIIRAPNGSVATGADGQPMAFKDLSQAAYAARKIRQAAPPAAGR